MQAIGYAVSTGASRMHGDIGGYVRKAWITSRRQDTFRERFFGGR